MLISGRGNWPRRFPTDFAISVSASLARNRGLESLDMYGCHIGDAGARAMGAALARNHVLQVSTHSPSGARTRICTHRTWARVRACTTAPTHATRVHSGWTSARTALRQVAVHCWRMGSWSIPVGACACNFCVLLLCEIGFSVLFCHGGCVGDSQNSRSKK